MAPQKIKLIATDVDGTLVKESSPAITDEQISLFQKLTDKGVTIAAASGRQFGSVSKVFAPVERELCYIVENGALIKKGNTVIHKVSMERQYVEGIMQDLRKLYDKGCHALVSTPGGSFVESKDEDFIRLLREGYRNDVTEVLDVLSLDADIIKIAVYKKGSIEQIGRQILLPQWKDRVKATLAGAEWVDFMDATVDKGNGLRLLMEHLSVRPEETMAFGDNENDLGLMQAAGESYAVGNAVETVKRAAKHVCPPYWEDGVSSVLRKVLESC